MSEQNSKSLSISFRVDDGYIDHNNRIKIASNVDPARISDNITYTQIEIKEFYHQIFDEALAEYNAKQKRADRKIPDYYEHIKKSGHTKPFYEVVVQFGDIHDCGIGTENFETAKTMLDEYMKKFEKRNPNLKVFNAVMHLDESTPHLHIDFVPVARKCQRGLSLKNSMSGALREQGFTSTSRLVNEWTAWSESERTFMEQILRKHGLSRNNKEVHRPHLSIAEYKQAVQEKQEIIKINAQINSLKKKNDTEFTSEDAVLFNNQNNFLRSEIVKRDKEISLLSQRVNIDFVPIDIYSEDKLQFVVAELKKRGIPFAEDITTLHIPEYAKQTATEIMSRYQPQRLGIRDRIRLDIDRLVYLSSDFDNLIYKLLECGYDIKHGKYIAVKPPYAERFTRLKTLGNPYLPYILEQRIMDRNHFINAVQTKRKNATPVASEIHTAVLGIITATKQFRLTPKKYDPRKIYAFDNDANIELLSRQLLTLNEFGLSSRQQIYEKAEELKADNSDEARTQLRRVNELIKVYETIVEGNYIDNLIKSQVETKQQHTPKNKR